MNPLLDVDARLVVGHRGNAAHAPENTIESFTQAIALGANALELDVHVTRDDVPVVHHDATVDRTTDGTGPIAARSLAELRELDAGARFTADAGRTHPYRGLGIGIPTLDAVLGAFPGVPVVVEVKTPRAAAATRAVLERHGAAGRCVVGAFDAAALAPFRDSPFALGATQRDVARLIAATLCGVRVAAPPYHALCLPLRFRGVQLPIERIARAMRPIGRTVHVWTVDDQREAVALWRAGVRGIITNDPSTILRVRPAS